MNKADPTKLGYVGKLQRDSNAWFTPPKYIELVREVLGEIDLDPFTCGEANAVVKAKRIFTEERNAFDNSWGDDFCYYQTVFMNPPYGRGILDRAVDKFLEEWNNRNVYEAIVLVNNATETEWFHKLVNTCCALCFVRGRISFYNLDGKAVSGNTRGQVFMYFCRLDGSRFRKTFSKIGFVC